MELVFFDTDQVPLMTFKSYDYSFPLVIPHKGEYVKLIQTGQEIEGIVTEINHTYNKTGAMSVHIMIKIEDSH